jgi:hypothetical protein
VERWNRLRCGEVGGEKNRRRKWKVVENRTEGNDEKDVERREFKRIESRRRSTWVVLKLRFSSSKEVQVAIGMFP